MRLHSLAWLLLAATAGADECRLMSGPDGLCARLRLDSGDRALRVGTTLRIRVQGVECDGRRRRLQWRSASPEIAVVDSTGLIRAVRPGVVEIRVEVAGVPADGIAARVTVVP